MMPDMTLGQISTSVSRNNRGGHKPLIIAKLYGGSVVWAERVSRDGAHQEDAETDENRHDVNEWLAHEPAFRGNVISRRHAAASGSNTTGSGMIKRLCVLFWILSLA